MSIPNCTSVCLRVLGNMRRIQLAQDLNFLLNILNFILCALQVNNLYRDRLLCSLIEAKTLV